MGTELRKTVTAKSRRPAPSCCAPRALGVFVAKRFKRKKGVPEIVTY